MIPRARHVLGRPGCVVGAGYAVLIALLLATHHGDPLFFATMGPEWARHDPAGDRWADGVMFYAIASDPLGRGLVFGDYRVERILYPMLARLVSAGQPWLVPWALVLLNWAGIVLGTEVMDRLLQRDGGPRWMALGYGAWGGLGAALMKDTAEPVTYAFALLAVWCLTSDRTALGCALTACAILGRETAVLLVAPYLLLSGSRRGLSRWLPVLLVGALWLGWVLIVRDVLRAPIVSRPTPRPLIGLLAIRPLDLPITLLAVIAPAVIALAVAARALISSARDARLWAVLLNALLVLSLPRETAAMFWHSGRVSTGLVASTLLATPFETLTPGLRRLLATLYVGSAAWTIAVAARYLVWDVVPLPGR